MSTIGPVWSLARVLVAHRELGAQTRGGVCPKASETLVGTTSILGNRMGD